MDEVAIFDEAIIHKRGEIWQFQMWLEKEGKYARESLKTRNQSTAIDKAKNRFHEIMADQIAGKTYFSKTTKQGVEEYLKQRAIDVEAKLIVKGRYTTIKTHLEHWLDFIHRDTKLKELNRVDCENYYQSRTKIKNGISISQTTVENEQSTINAMISWLYKRKETYIDAFDFKPLPRIDKGDAANRRDTFTNDEIRDIKKKLEEIVNIGKKSDFDDGDLKKVIVAYYFLIAIITGMRKGELVQLRWGDVEFVEKEVKGQANNSRSLVRVKVRGETSKVRKTRIFYIEDLEYFDELFKLQYSHYKKESKDRGDVETFGNTLVFNAGSGAAPTPRVIGLHFEKLLELAGIENTDSRDLAPSYSFRHYFITNMINKGFNPTQVSDACGTSVTQIAQTYYHALEDKLIENALPGFHYKDGMLIPK
ncbi:site-specific integrase [Massilia sp. Root351]|uniref:tyrosine-type recombinase/integrase n=1 Tax=Massilia sp. Root351 TaxID=1736522 RepID=UPI001E42A7D7|nr:site-specific integrase [Massilia sp. Root351]